MSGSMDHTSDIHLPRKEEATETVSPTPSPRHSFTFSQLNSLPVIVIRSIFASSGLVTIDDFAFVVLFSFFYIYFLSKVAFPPLSPRPESPVFEKSLLVNLYFRVGALIGLILPIGSIFESICKGNKEGIKAAASHVFLLTSQIFMERAAFSRGFSLPIRAFISVFYNTRRIFTIVDWLKIEIVKVDEEHGSLRRSHVGMALAVANLAFWCFIILGSLVPVYIPKVFKRYYGYNIKD